MEVNIIQVPYDSGLRDFRHGRGPRAILADGLIDCLEADTHVVRECIVTVGEGVEGEIAVAFDLACRISIEVAAARATGAFPLVIAGNCNASLGAVSGAGDRTALGVVWLDAHADFHTPETTETGFLDGMGLAILAGHCWRTLATAKVSGYAPVATGHIVLVGAHAVDKREADRLDEAGVACVGADAIRAGANGGVSEVLRPPLDRLLREGVRHVQLHIDMDVHDPASIPANGWSVEGGLTAREVLDVIGAIGGTFEIIGTSLASLDPEVDRAGDATKAAVRLLRAVVRLAAATGPGGWRTGFQRRGAIT